MLCSVCVFLHISACVHVCGHLLCPSLSLTFLSHTQVRPSVSSPSNGSEWQEVNQRMSVNVCLCGYLFLKRCMCFYMHVCLSVFVCVLLTTNPPDGSCDVKAFNYISVELIGMCRCVSPGFFSLLGFKNAKLNKVEVMQSASDSERFEKVIHWNKF